ncbi:metallophosphoesterase [Aliikangiella coralliicola]|uniref:Metallophosphoesterase n=1 Tax=Aliikangiella coralliicola TaxID=2592383 RepID=A0A545UJ04_9GAMM|nr:metallophosphoesterase [Aliikangiella coralliicola]TQV89446.1 metallophosphoesterase [Aliikangiella coralliicola]
MRQQLVLLSVIFLGVASISTVFSSEISDGPYVFEKGKQREVVWVCDGKKQVFKVDLIVPQTLNGCSGNVKLWSPAPSEDEQLEYAGEYRVAAASDIHGQFDLFLQLLKNNNILDKNDKWNFSNGHFVITGDVFDRGPKVTEALWFLYDLEKQAERAGGKLHLLLGNHEVMTLNGDLRYLNEKYLETAEITNTAYEDLYAKNSVLGDWLRSRPVLVKVNGILFAHGGFHPDLAEIEMSAKDVNDLFKQNLVEKELAKPRYGMGQYLHKSKGPIWYRGYFREDEISSDELNQLLNHFGATHIVVGHTTQEAIKSVHDGRVIAIDAGMKYGSYGELLLWDGGEFTRGTLAGKKFPLGKATKATKTRSNLAKESAN